MVKSVQELDIEQSDIVSVWVLWVLSSAVSARMGMNLIPEHESHC